MESTDDSNECEFANFWLLASVQLHFFYYIIDSKKTNGVIFCFCVLLLGGNHLNVCGELSSYHLNMCRPAKFQ